MQTEPYVILIVDDSLYNCDLLTRHIQRQGYTPVVAHHGQMALDCLHSQAVDLMLLDIMMPGMSGYEVLEYIQADATLRHIPVIVISAIDDVDSVVKCIHLGAEDYLSKPFNPALLKARIKACLDKKRLYDQQQIYLQELQTIQRIDRELNASLDVQRVMQITLEWAIRRSKADAGLIGMVTPDALQVVATHGYVTASSIPHKGYIPLDLPTIKIVVQSGELQLHRLNQQDNAPRLLPTGQCQLVLPIRREHQVIGVLLLESAILRDCSEEILAFLIRLCDHAAIALANAQLYAALQSANAAKSEFVSFVSHELKTPMTSIMGYTDMLLSQRFGDVNETQVKFLQTMRTNVMMMTSLVSDLTDISRIESGHLSLDYSAVALSEIVEAVVQSVYSQIEARSQTLMVHISDNLPLIRGDRMRLIQIVTNLVSNAYKYTPRGGSIVIRAEYTTLSSPQGGEQPMVCLMVEDDGIGIDVEDQPRIFEQFFRANTYGVDAPSGTGLGLHITRRLVELQGGRVWFTSMRNQGTTFYVAIPIAAAARHGTPPAGETCR